MKTHTHDPIQVMIDFISKVYEKKINLNQERVRGLETPSFPLTNFRHFTCFYHCSSSVRFGSVRFVAKKQCSEHVSILQFVSLNFCHCTFSSSVHCSKVMQCTVLYCTCTTAWSRTQLGVRPLFFRDNNIASKNKGVQACRYVVQKMDS